MPVTSDAATALASPDVVATAGPGPQPQSSDLPNQIAPVAAQPVPASLAQSQPQAQVPSHVIRDSAIGKGVRALANLVHGRETTYSVDANGNMVENHPPARPGAVFRNILMGALIGGAVSSQERSHGFVQGFSRGGAAGMEAQQAQDAQKRQYARQTFQDQLAAQREKREQQSALSEDQVRQATIAHLTAQTATAYHTMALQNQEEIERKNAAARAMIQTLKDAGGVQAEINGKDSMSALELSKEYVKDPTIRQAQAGYTRIFVDTHNLSQLHWDGQQWRDDSGNVADMGEHSTVVACDLPNNTMKTLRQLDGKTINQLRGAKIADENKTYSISPDAASALYTLNLQDQNRKAQADSREANAAKRAQAGKKFAEIEAKKSAALAKAEQNYWSAINSGKVSEENAQAQLNEAKQAAQDAYEAEIRAAGGTPQRFTYSKTPQANAPSQPKTFSPSKWKAANPNGDVNAAIAQAKSQGIQVIQ